MSKYLKLVFCAFFAIVLLCSVKTVAYEQFDSNNDIISEKNVKYFLSFYDLMNKNIDAKRASKVYYTNPNDIMNKIIYPIFSSPDYNNGYLKLMQLKYTKLKNTCNLVPSPANKVNKSTACAQILVDVDGFSRGPNKLFRDKTTMLQKDQFIVLLYANGVRLEYLSPEELVYYTYRHE